MHCDQWSTKFTTPVDTGNVSALAELQHGLLGSDKKGNVAR